MVLQNLPRLPDGEVKMFKICHISEPFAVAFKQVFTFHPAIGLERCRTGCRYEGPYHSDRELQASIPALEILHNP